MSKHIGRRQFLEMAGIGSTLPLLAQRKRNLKIGHTGITWVQPPPPRPANADGAPPAAGRGGGGPRRVDPDYIENIFKDVSGLGYYGLELFSFQIQGMEANGGIASLIEKYNLPLISAYGGPNLLDTAQRKENLAQAIEWGKLLKKYGGKVVTIGPNGVRRDSYNFKEHKDDIVVTLNEYCKALTDIGLTGCLHQHTGTCIETRDEVYAVLEAVDTKVVKFGPDVGQLAKGGADPVKMVKDFLPLIRHVHLKDWNGGPHWAEYCPLGQGKVDLPAVLDLLEQSKDMKIVMVELDPSAKAPLTPVETARTSKEYLHKMGYTFRSA